MGTYWAYVNNHYKWYAWYYLEGETQVKLGPFSTQEEAIKAAENYEDTHIK